MVIKISFWLLPGSIVDLWRGTVSSGASVVQVCTRCLMNAKHRSNSLQVIRVGRSTNSAMLGLILCEGFLRLLFKLIDELMFHSLAKKRLLVVLSSTCTPQWYIRVLWSSLATRKVTGIHKSKLYNNKYNMYFVDRILGDAANWRNLLLTGQDRTGQVPRTTTKAGSAPNQGQSRIFFLPVEAGGE